MDDIPKLRRILGESRTLAIVGLSANWYRPSYFAAKYMQEHGYRVIPVNPMYAEVLGEKCYKSLRDIPGKVDLVDCFRKSEEIPALVDDVVAIGAKGCVTFSPTPVRNYRDFLAIDDRWSHCHWLYQHNGGVFLPPWGKAEQWLLSAQHTDEDVDRFLANLAAFAEAVGR